MRVYSRSQILRYLRSNPTNPLSDEEVANALLTALSDIESLETRIEELENGKANDGSRCSYGRDNCQAE